MQQISKIEGKLEKDAINYNLSKDAGIYYTNINNIYYQYSLMLDRGSQSSKQYIIK